MPRAVLMSLAVAVLATAPGARASSSSCLFTGPVHSGLTSPGGFEGRTFNYPEDLATYWLARFTLRPGDDLVLHGRFPHARYLSLVTYAAGGTPLDGVGDAAIVADAGATNPFVPGARRTARRRGYTLRIAPGLPPAAGAARPANTLYAGEPGARTEALLRVYDPDRGRDLTGGAGLPRVALRRAGQALTGVAACAAVNDPDRSIPVLTITARQWRALIAAGGGDPATSPAFRRPRWERFFNQAAAGTAFAYFGGRATLAARNAAIAAGGGDAGGFYSNADSRYVLTHLSRRYGRVVVTTGRLPRFAATFANARRAPRHVQVRYWSICMNESRVSLRTTGCVADRQLPLARGRRYTVVVSPARDRPRNARARCGVRWLRWGDGGDRAGRRGYGLLIVRNLAASAGFARAIQRVTRFGDERRAMGPYLPVSRYTSRRAFERRGCRR